MDAEEQHEAEDHQQQSHDVLQSGGWPLASLAYHFRGLGRNARKRAGLTITRSHSGMVRRTRPQMCNCTSGNLEIPGSRGACHWAALRADPLARPGMTNVEACNPVQTT